MLSVRTTAGHDDRPLAIPYGHPAVRLFRDAVERSGGEVQASTLARKRLVPAPFAMNAPGDELPTALNVPA
jgi:hypothetical protein